MKQTDINPTDTTVNQWHIQTTKECSYNESCFSALQNVPWAQKIIQSIESNGGLKDPRTIGYLFELRFAYQLLCAGLSPVIEYPTGEGKSTVDFFFEHNYKWLMELVACDETAGIKRATTAYQPGEPFEETVFHSPIKIMELRSNSEDHTQTEEWEVIKLQEKILEKVWRHGGVRKFPSFSANSLQMIVVDARGFLGGDGPDEHDVALIAYGAKYVDPPYQRFFKGKLIQGIFDREYPEKSAIALQERVHCIMFIVEQAFEPEEIWKTAIACWNHYISDTDDMAKHFPWKIKLHLRPLVQQITEHSI